MACSRQSIAPLGSAAAGDYARSKCASIPRQRWPATLSFLVRQALRKLRGVEVWGSGTLEAAAGLPAEAGPELAKELGVQGLIRKLQRDTWTMRPAGMTFTAATASNG